MRFRLPVKLINTIRSNKCFSCVCVFFRGNLWHQNRRSATCEMLIILYRKTHETVRWMLKVHENFAQNRKCVYHYGGKVKCSRARVDCNCNEFIFRSVNILSYHILIKQLVVRVIYINISEDIKLNCVLSVLPLVTHQYNVLKIVCECKCLKRIVFAHRQCTPATFHIFNQMFRINQVAEIRS